MHGRRAASFAGGRAPCGIEFHGTLFEQALEFGRAAIVVGQQQTDVGVFQRLSQKCAIRGSGTRRLLCGVAQQGQLVAIGGRRCVDRATLGNRCIGLVDGAGTRCQFGRGTSLDIGAMRQHCAKLRIRCRCAYRG